jgi:hypothetical protein
MICICTKKISGLPTKRQRRKGGELLRQDVKRGMEFHGAEIMASKSTVQGKYRKEKTIQKINAS